MCEGPIRPVVIVAAFADQLRGRSQSLGIGFGLVSFRDRFLASGLLAGEGGFGLLSAARARWRIVPDMDQPNHVVKQHCRDRHRDEQGEEHGNSIASRELLQSIEN